jgi:hypothetical protein
LSVEKLGVQRWAFFFVFVRRRLLAHELDGFLQACSTLSMGQPHSQETPPQ